MMIRVKAMFWLPSANIKLLAVASCPMVAWHRLLWLAICCWYGRGQACMPWAKNN
jgi:hypothetical protein